MNCTKETSLPGRDIPLFKPKNLHSVLKTSLFQPFPSHSKWIIFGMGCFWGAEKIYWQQNGVYSTQVGYSGGYTKNPTYEETCTGKTGHAEVVRVIYEPEKISLSKLLDIFWENHDPTTLNRQGNDTGTVYRSAIYYPDESLFDEIEQSKLNFQTQLDRHGLGKIVTEIKLTGEFYYAEDYHQQYLHKNPNGYCGLQRTGVKCYN